MDAKVKISLEDDELRTLMLSKLKKENEAELKLTKEQLRRERDIEIDKLNLKISEEQTICKKVFEIKSVGHEKAIKLFYLDDKKESKRIEQVSKEQLEQNKGFKLKLEVKITDLNKNFDKSEQDKEDLKESQTKDSLS